MNNTRLEEDKNNNENSKILYFDEIRKEFIPINYDSFVDKLKPLPKIKPTNDPKKAKFFERILHPIQYGSLRGSIFGLSSILS